MGRIRQIPKQGKAHLRLFSIFFSDLRRRAKLQARLFGSDVISASMTRIAQARRRLWPPNVAAIIAWSNTSSDRYTELGNMRQLTLVVNGNDDIIIPTINSYNLSQRIRGAQLIIYPDSGHGALFQFPELFVAHGTMFLET